MNREAVIERLRALRPPAWGGASSFRDLFLGEMTEAVDWAEHAG
jgi:hypothetical protein